MRFVPYSDDDGTLNVGWALVIGVFALVALAASVYLVIVLEILKFKRFRERELRRQVETGEIAALSEREIETEVEREVETGEFEAVRRPETMDGSAEHPAPRSETDARPPAPRNQAVSRD
jgi:UDP-GlcNAc:undecaprenyl-phosphate/decaprenyl-phosphate GlcNAc-1-phosphate transferase